MKVTTKGLVTILPQVRDFLQIEPHDETDFLVEGTPKLPVTSF